MGRFRRILLAVLAVLAVAGCACSDEPAERPGARRVVLISIDTLRPERLGVHGNSAEVSPHIDALAKRGVVFEDALSSAPWTLPSHMSLLTGLDPLAHGVRTEQDVLADEVSTLAERLREAGFGTAAFTDGGFVAARYGFDQGFDRYADARTPRGPNGFRRLLPDALEWIEAQGDAPFFVFLHTFDAHAPYTKADAAVLARFRERAAPTGDTDHWLATTRYLHAQRRAGVQRYGRLSLLLNDYDAGVHMADRGVGEVLDVLDRNGRLDDALVIVTSDHGESFLDRGPYVGHGLGLTDDELAVPLIVKWPRDAHAGERSEAPVDLLDVVPTVLAAVGLPADPALPGVGLQDRLTRDSADRVRFAESTNTGAFAWIEGEHKYISAPRMDGWEIARTHLGPVTPPVLAPSSTEEEYAMGGIGRGAMLRYDVVGDPLAMIELWERSARLYRRSTDPGEVDDLATREPERVEAMRERLADFLERRAEAAPRGAEAVDLEPARRAELAALGYLAEGGASGAALALPPDRILEARPSMEPLWAQDRIVHAIRMTALVEGVGAVDVEAAARAFERARDVFSGWAATHPRLAARAQWRLGELARLEEGLVRARAAASTEVDRGGSEAATP